MRRNEKSIIAFFGMSFVLTWISAIILILLTGKENLSRKNKKVVSLGELAVQP